MSPKQVKEMTIFEFSCALTGYHRYHSASEELEPPTAEEFEAAKAFYGDD